jgi:hypothetical protein
VKIEHVVPMTKSNLASAEAKGVVDILVVVVAVVVVEEVSMMLVLL